MLDYNINLTTSKVQDTWCLQLEEVEIFQTSLYTWFPCCKQEIDKQTFFPSMLTGKSLVSENT